MPSRLSASIRVSSPRSGRLDDVRYARCVSESHDLARPRAKRGLDAGTCKRRLEAGSAAGPAAVAAHLIAQPSRQPARAGVAVAAHMTKDEPRKWRIQPHDYICSG